MNKITVNKIIGYKKWIAVEVIEGSDEHQEILRWNKAMHIIQWQDKKEMDKQSEIAENEISYEQKQEETGFELVDEDEPSPEEWYIQNEENRVIWEAVQKLPENQQHNRRSFLLPWLLLQRNCPYVGQTPLYNTKKLSIGIGQAETHSRRKNFLRSFQFSASQGGHSCKKTSFT